MLMAVALACASTSWAQGAEWVRAVVVKVDPARARVTLDHQTIQSIGMAPMVMPFKVDAAVQLARFKPGDKVRFAVATRDDHLVVSAMEPVK